MNKKPKIKCSVRNKYLFLALLLLGAALRIFQLGATPCGINQDEAFAGYEAFSLLNYGMDSAGYHNPTYFVSWGSGMNVLESYLAIPFVWLLGNTALAIRMPVVILYLISIPVFFLLLKELYNETTAMIGMAVLSVCPWHIIASRWGLESNLAPVFLLFGLFFLIKGFRDNRFFPAAAVMYGLSLYTYALTWLVVPFTLALVFGYMMLCRYRFSVKYAALAVGILFVMALPHMLFLLINAELIPEIRTGWFSIPKMVAMRSSEISPKNLLSGENVLLVVRLLLGLGDDLAWNGMPEFGMYYYISTPFILYGLYVTIRSAVSQVRSRQFRPDVVLWIGLTCSLCTALLVKPININKANHLHFYTVTLIAVGISSWLKTVSGKKRLWAGLLTAVYAVCVLAFSCAYFQTFDERIAEKFADGLQECVAFAKEQEFDCITVDHSFTHSRILYFDETPTPTFIQTGEYLWYPDPFLMAARFGGYEFGVDYGNPEQYTACIVPASKADAFPDSFTRVCFGVCCVVYR